MERKIGEIFEYNGEWCQCLEDNGCSGCVFLDSGCDEIKSVRGKCARSEREDRKSVIFKKLEKVGEPYEYFIQGMGIIMVQEYILANANYIWEYSQDVVVMDSQNGKVAIGIQQTKEDMENQSSDVHPYGEKQQRVGEVSTNVVNKEGNIYLVHGVEEPTIVRGKKVQLAYTDAGCENCVFYKDPYCLNPTNGRCDCNNGEDGIYIEVKEDMKEKNNGNTPLNVLTDKYVNGDICYDDFEKEVKALYSRKEEIKPTLKEFDLEAAKAGKPVCTRDGRKARIICFDAKYEEDYKPIIALIDNGKNEFVVRYKKNGECLTNDNLDLVMLPEKKEGWVNVYKTDCGIILSKQPYTSKEEAIKNAGIVYNRIDTVKISWEE